MTTKKQRIEEAEAAIDAARRALARITGEDAPEPKPEKNAAAVALGKLGASKGGKARAASMTARRRKEIAERAAAARWGKEESAT